MSRLFGIETEYGIWTSGRDTADLMEEARAVVRAYTGASAGPWDYRPEDPRRDMRGFKVDHLNSNPTDAQYDRPGGPTMSMAEQRNDRVLVNGARLYNDHGHPEYATPECRRLRDLVAHDKAGERIVLAAAQALSATRRPASRGRPGEDEERPFNGEVSIYKNNTDFHGMSYGCHEGYLVPREVPFEALFRGVLPFFVTRQIFAGAGKVGVETSGPFAEQCQFQLSQRADFFTEEASVDTLHRRPIVNTRDEPHADPRKYRRFHVIVGDANMVVCDGAESGYDTARAGADRHGLGAVGAAASARGGDQAGVARSLAAVGGGAGGRPHHAGDGPPAALHAGSREAARWPRRGHGVDAAGAGARAG